MIGIGINTGTSADAIDVAVVEFGRTRPRLSIKLLWSGAYRYPAELKQLFLELVDFTNTLTPSTWFDMAGRFDFGLGMAFSDAVLKAIRASGVRKSSIAFIGSHGQTVWHSPAPAGHSRGKRFTTGSTIQLGSPSAAAVRTGIPVVAHFRDKDIALGGQGAPLAPVLHFELFRKYAPAIVLNIGGIANITVLPSRRDFSRVYGFDTGPGNRLIDIAAGAYTNGRQSFDRDGRLANTGVADTELLSRLMHDRFIRRRPPKSTGREHYNKTYLTMQGIRLDDIHTIAALTAFTARSIAYNIEHFVKTPVKNIIVCGGGTRNGAILKQLSGLMPGVTIKTVEELGYNSFSIEPMLFAYLGYLGFNRIPVSFKNITGSSLAFVPGGIYYP
ncbi:MAG: anhydro-N-acetylmuramic acid kinase [Deltaproteobacteria bacterium]|nr:anhydro-N-acetylmuramic acid kinase [Deltaproteobacteria bacterium]